MSTCRGILLVMLSCLGNVSAAAVIPLDSLLEDMQDGPAVRAAGHTVRQLEAELGDRKLERGWSVFGSVSQGRVQELVGDNATDQYTSTTLALGLRYPLLGTLRRNTLAIREAGLDVSLQKLDQQLARAEQRLAVRSVYADWWRVQATAELCEQAEELASFERVLVRRRAASGGILESDTMLIANRWKGLIQRCSDLGSVQAMLQSRLENLTGLALSPFARPTTTPLPAAPAPGAEWQDVIEKDPRVLQRQASIELAKETREGTWYDTVDADLTIAQQLDRRRHRSDTGVGLIVSLNFRMPLQSLAQMRSHSGGEAAYLAAVDRLEYQRQQLMREVADTLQGHRQRIQELLLQRDELIHTTRVEYERAARQQVDGDPGFRRLRLARLARMTAHFDLIVAWHGAWLSTAELKLLGENDGVVDELMGDRYLVWTGDAIEETTDPAGSSLDLTWDQAAYVWKSASLIDPGNRADTLKALKQAGIGRIYLSFDPQQVRDLPQLRGEVRQLLRQARDERMHVHLLLGEPLWITPAHREDLVQIIGRFADLPFDGLVLDLEVEQLGWPVSSQRLQDWLDTLQAATNSSPWPVSIASHHRWFQPDNEAYPCVPCALPSIGISDISLMYYNANVERSTETMLRLSKHWPDLRFRLAQSVESELSPQESWSGSSTVQLQERVKQWESRLKPAGAAGIDWQDWQSHPGATE